MRKIAQSRRELGKPINDPGQFSIDTSRRLGALAKRLADGECQKRDLAAQIVVYFA